MTKSLLSDEYSDALRSLKNQAAILENKDTQQLDIESLLEMHNCMVVNAMACHHILRLASRKRIKLHRVTEKDVAEWIEAENDDQLNRSSN